MAIVLGHLMKEGPLVPATLFASVGLATALVPRVTAASVPRYYCKIVQFVLNTAVPIMYSCTARIEVSSSIRLRKRTNIGILGNPNHRSSATHGP